MDMIEVKTDDLIGPALDYVIAQIEGVAVKREYSGDDGHGNCVIWLSYLKSAGAFAYAPSINWELGGPILEDNDWALPYRATARYHLGKYEACSPGGLPHNGPTPLIAACRAIVAAEYGTTVKVPAELMPKVEK